MLGWLFNRKPNGKRDPHPGQKLVWVRFGRTALPVKVIKILPHPGVTDCYRVIVTQQNESQSIGTVEFSIFKNKLLWDRNNYLRYPHIFDRFSNFLSSGEAGWRTYDGDPE